MWDHQASHQADQALRLQGRKMRATFGPCACDDGCGDESVKRKSAHEAAT